MIECKPTPYLILQGLKNCERIVSVIEQDGVTLTVTAYACQYAISKPNGTNNEAVPSEYLKKGGLNIARASDGSQLALMPADHEVSKVSNKLQAAKDFDATMNGSD